MRRAYQGVVILHGALVQGLLLVSAGVVHCTDVVVVQAHQADRLSKLLDDTDYEAADRTTGEIWDESLASDR